MMTDATCPVSAVVTSSPTALFELVTVTVSPGPPARAAWNTLMFEFVPFARPTCA